MSESNVEGCVCGRATDERDFHTTLFIFSQPIQKDIFEKQHYLPRGGSLGNGVMNVTVDFTYHCQPLEVGMKEYTVCIAMEKNDHSYLFKHDGIGGFFLFTIDHFTNIRNL